MNSNLKPNNWNILSRIKRDFVVNTQHDSFASLYPFASLCPEYFHFSSHQPVVNIVKLTKRGKCRDKVKSIQLNSLGTTKSNSLISLLGQEYENSSESGCSRDSSHSSRISHLKFYFTVTVCSTKWSIAATKALFVILVNYLK